MCTAIQNNSVESSIKKKLIDSLNPSYIEIINESYMHNVPKGSETHFKIIAVSDKFKDVPLIKVRILNVIKFSVKYLKYEIFNFIIRLIRLFS